MNKSIKSKNYWATEKPGFAFASWEIVLNYPDSKSKMNQLFNLYKEISQVGEEFDIYRVVKKNCQPKDVSIFSYSNYMEKAFSEEGKLYSFGGNASFDRYSKIAYYNRDNDLQTNYINDMGSLLIETRDISREITLHRFIRKTPPMHISEGLISDVNNYNNHSDTINIYIDLFTDVWFPWLIGILEDKNSANNSVSHPILGKAYDNRELAYYHTSQLNNFLSIISRLVLDYGGQWEKGEDYSFYEKMFTEEGIILD
jgi:hypothetical protein